MLSDGASSDAPEKPLRVAFASQRLATLSFD